MLFFFLVLLLGICEENTCNDDMGYAIRIFKNQMQELYFMEDIKCRKCFYFREQELLDERCIHMAITSVNKDQFEDRARQTFPQLKFSWIQRKVLNKEVAWLWVYSRPSFIQKILMFWRRIFGCKNEHSLFCTFL